MKKYKNILIVCILAITFVMVITLVATRIQGKTPQLFGYQILRVSSSSMEPTLETGDIILSKKVSDISALEVGDIVTYKGEQDSYKDKTITHEVIVKPYEYDGKYYLQTRGIANGYIDPEISEDQVIGVMIRRMPLFSAAYSFFLTPWGLVVILGFLAILFINEAFTLVRLVKEEKAQLSSDGSEDTDTEEESTQEDTVQEEATQEDIIQEDIIQTETQS